MKLVYAFVALTLGFTACQRPSGLDSDGKIVGGKLAKPAEHPYMVSVLTQSQSGAFFLHCGATLIQSRLALTAAHCVEELVGKPELNLYVGFGSADANAFTEKTTLKVKNVRMHEGFDSLTMSNDLAILLLPDYDDTAFAVKPQPIALSQSADDIDNAAILEATGFGNTTSFGYLSDARLHSVLVKPVPNDDCKTLLKETGNVIDSRVMCAGSPDVGGYDTCQGDSGGPLVLPAKSGLPTLVAVTSWGDGCALEKKPGVYSRVASFKSWIDSNSRSLLNADINDKETIFRELRTHCANSFSEVQNFQTNDAMGTVTIAYLPAKTPDLLDTTGRMTAWASQFNEDPDHIFRFSCAYSVADKNDHVAWVNRDDAAKPQIMVNQTVTGKMLHYPVIGRLSVDAICRSFEDTRMSVNFNDGNLAGNRIQTADGSFLFSTPAADPDLANDPYTVINSCTLGDFTFKIWQNDATKKYLVSVKGPHIAAAQAWYVGTEFPADQAREPQVTMKVTKVSDTEATVAIKNTSAKSSIYTWRLLCSLGGTLTDEYGQSYSTDSNTSEKSWLFSYPVVSLGRIAPGQTYEFRYIHDKDADVTAMATCDINGERLRFEYSAK